MSRLSIVFITLLWICVFFIITSMQVWAEAEIGAGTGAEAAQVATPRHLTPEAQAAREQLRQVQYGEAPEKVYGAFNEFARIHFGAEAEPLVYELYGAQLEILPESAWRYVSENSASLAWETNIPAYSYVEYGPTSEYGHRTPITERQFYLHIHRLTGLELNKTYHYRLVAIDERGNRVTFPDQVLTTAPIPAAVYLTNTADRQPHRLTQPNTTYILKEDLTVDGSALVVMAKDITIDLNGHTISFAHNPTGGGNYAGISIIKQAGSGGTGGTSGAQAQVQSQAKASYTVKVVNGIITQAPPGAHFAGNTSTERYNCLSAGGGHLEIAGITCIYHAPQAWGMVLQENDMLDIHHNIFLDMGTEITDRHGAGVRPLGIQRPVETPNRFQLHHNLVKRTRQNGFNNATRMYNNEIYVDSWSTNSFAIQPLSVVGVAAGEYYNNKVFGTGFNPYGFGWAHEDLRIHDNFVHMHGFDLRHRWYERWGDINMLSGMRITNYDSGGQVRNNLEYWNNTIVLRGAEDAELRGIEFFSDNSITGVVFRNNHVKAEALDEQTKRVAAVVGQGHYKKLDSRPVYYIDNLLESNIAIIRFGDAYGVGHNHRFIGNTLKKLGNDPSFHTFVFDGGNYSTENLVQDTIFLPGTAYNDVRWQKTLSNSSYAVAWTVEVVSLPETLITISDKDGREVFRGYTDADGRLATPLVQCLIRPTEWMPPFDIVVLWEDMHKEHTLNPYTITAQKDNWTASRSINVVEKTEVTLLP